MTTAPTLDIDKFAKVHRLMKEGATEGERGAAKARAEAMAKRAGLTLKQAASKMDAAPPRSAGPSFTDIFGGFDDWMEDKEPGYKAKKAAERQEREAARQVKLREVLSRYGTEDALFAETPQEAALRDALVPLAIYGTYANAAELPPDQRRFVSGYGYSGGEPRPTLLAVMRQAIPIPDTVSAAWEEYCQWESLVDDRCAAFPDYGPTAHVRARQYLLEHLLDTMTDATVAGISARLDWLNHVSNVGYTRDVLYDQALASVLRADFATLAMTIQNGPAPRSPNPGTGLHRSNAAKRRDVMSMLDAEPGLTDREIARRCGVSPQSVGNWRRQKQEQQA